MALIGATIIALAEGGRAATITVHAPDGDARVFVDVVGQINDADFQTFKEKADQIYPSGSGHPDKQVIVTLMSYGGSTSAGLQIGDYIRKRGMTTFVPGDRTCTSACALIWLAGIPRTVGNTPQIGFHAAFDPTTRRETGQGNAVIGAYLRDLGIGYKAIVFMTRKGPTSVEWLTPDLSKELAVAWAMLQLPRAIPIPPQPKLQLRLQPPLQVIAAWSESAKSLARTASLQDEMGRFVSKVLGSTEVQWTRIFAKDGKTYSAPVLVLYKEATQASCGGVAWSAMGAFYCPTDQKVYVDTSFFDQIAARFRGCDLGTRACQFSEAYVIAHEVGHHVQNLLGILPKAQQAQRAADSKAGAKHIQIQVELQADCLAGLWANRENESLRSEGKPAFIELGDIEAALRTAAAIGDDTLQRKAQGYVVPDSFTHGSTEQRQRWFTAGFKSGSVASCNTFAAAQP
jgi:predicted metalloprotease